MVKKGYPLDEVRTALLPSQADQEVTYEEEISA